MKRFFAFLLLLWAAIILLLPKERLYYTAERLAGSSLGIYLNDERLENRFVFLTARDATLLIDTAAVGTVETIRLLPWIVFNRITIRNVSFTGEFAALFPGGIDRLTFTYSLLDPLHIVIEGEGGFGPVRGNISLVPSHLTLYFEPSVELRRYPMLLAKLHPSPQGLLYETEF